MVQDLGYLKESASQTAGPYVHIGLTPNFADINWLAVLVAMNLQMSFLTPPFGWALFFLKGVADTQDPTALFQADRIHPNEAAQPTMLDNVWPELRKLLAAR